MGSYGDLWRGEMLYYQLFQLGMVGMLLLFVFVTVWYAMLTCVLYFLAFQYTMVLRRDKKKEKHEGERHLETHTLREKDYREDKIYSFLHYTELDIRSRPPCDITELPEYQQELCFILNLAESEKLAMEPPQPQVLPQIENGDAKKDGQQPANSASNTGTGTNTAITTSKH